jgi:hypothetical protein
MQRDTSSLLPTAAELLVALDSRVAHHFSPAASQMKLVLLVLPRTSFGRADLTAPVVVVVVVVAFVEAAKIAFAAAAVVSVVAADYSTVPL